MCQKGKRCSERDKAEGFKARLRPRLRLRPEGGGWRPAVGATTLFFSALALSLIHI